MTWLTRVLTPVPKPVRERTEEIDRLAAHREALSQEISRLLPKITRKEPDPDA